ncbi:MAG: hypothetical protein Q7S68_05625 [Deltaproteobacteria bacterium]|nr:hypothetical protein [Deltaproteobacteria bacterium]
MSVTAGKLSTQVLEKALENTQKENRPMQAGDSPFQDMLQNTEEMMNLSDMLGAGKGQTVPTGDVGVMSAQDIQFDMSNNGGAYNVDKVQGSSVVGMLSDFNQQQMNMDGLINEIMYGKNKFNNNELLAIQAHVFHVAQMTEMTVKAVELTVSSFKGIMNTQIQ